jgi:beta-galactosidase
MTRHQHLAFPIARSFGRFLVCLLLLDSFLAPFVHAQPLAADRSRTSLDAGWRFALGNAADPALDFGFGSGHPWAKAGEALGAIAPEFDDSQWRDINLPHDWVVELPFVQDPDDNHVFHGSKPIGRRYPATTIGWYRKRFSIPKDDEGRRISIEFDGVFRDSLVWVNGHLLAHNESGYSGFGFDASDVLNYGGENTLVVRADATHPEGWFYEGAGIYRHVWLIKTLPLHITTDGITIRTDIDEATGAATATVLTSVANESDAPASVIIETNLFDPTGAVVTQAISAPIAIGPRETEEDVSDLDAGKPSLWSPDSPSLYRVETVVRRAGGNPNSIDSLTTRFGFRTVRFDKDHGFFLNGKPLKIKGVCCHQDHAGVGSALPDALQYFRISKLKEMGTNGYRTAHNPPTPELLDACDELGMMVLDENRLIGSSDEILSQLSRMIVRDRNRPCVIAWSIGNEEPEQYTPRGRRIAETMERTVHDLDPTPPGRQVTFASNAGGQYKGINQTVDVRGFNYFMNDIERYHTDHPEQPLLGTETASAFYTRGEYAADKVHGYVSAYDTNRPGYGATAAEWLRVYMTREYLAGGFVWTGFDYRGEPSPYAWPCISSHFGIIDTCGFPKDVFYYYKSWWTDQPVLHILPHWNWAGREGKDIDVWCFTNCERVRLTLNGKDLGERTVEKLGHAEWKVPYEPGMLEAMGYSDERMILRSEVATTHKPILLSIRQEASHAPVNRQDAAILTISAHDDGGQIVPDADFDVTFTLEGPGEILGVGNGDPSCHDLDRVVPQTFSRATDGWRTAALPEVPKSPPSIADLEKLPSSPFDAGGEAEGIPEHKVAAYWTTIRPTPGELTADSLGLSIGVIDDDGWVYLNGKLIATAKDYKQLGPCPLKGALHEGNNDLIVVVRNHQGPGGMGKGVRISGRTACPPWHRHLFHGLAQVIVQPNATQDTTLRATAADMTPASLTITRPH